MKKEWATKIKMDAIKNATTEHLTNWLERNKEIYDKIVDNQQFNSLKNQPIQDKNSGRYTKPQTYMKLYETIKQEIENRHNETKTAKTNVKKVLHKNRTKTIDKTKKNNYITNTIAGQSRKTKTTTKKRSTMTNNNLTKNSLTKKQLAAFETVYHHIWRTISNTIPMNNKKMRSAGFEQARIETIKLLKKIY